MYLVKGTASIRSLSCDLRPGLDTAAGFIKYLSSLSNKIFPKDYLFFPSVYRYRILAREVPTGSCWGNVLGRVASLGFSGVSH